MLASCFRRMPNAACTNVRNSTSSSSGTIGSFSGVILITDDSTLGGGVNALAATLLTISACATACTFTVSAPYSRESGKATMRWATSS